MFCRLWQHVSEAISNGDQAAATAEKSILEDAQRASARERKAKMEEWIPRFFEQNLVTGDWVYKFAEWVKERLHIYSSLQQFEHLKL